MGNPAHMSLDQRWLLTHSFARCSLLHYACAGDQLIVVRFLIEQGADRNITNLANREPDYYTMDERIREYLWTAPTLQVLGVAKGDTQARPRRLSVFNGGGGTNNTVSVADEVEEPRPVYPMPTEYVDPDEIQETRVNAHQPPPRPPPQHRPSQISNAMNSLFAANSEPTIPTAAMTVQRTPPPPPMGAHRGAPPPPPPPPGTSFVSAAPSSSSGVHVLPAPPKSLPPPPTGRNPSIMVNSGPPALSSSVAPARASSIAQLIERTRKSIRIEEEAGSSILTATPFSNGQPPVITVETKPRLSISKRRLSRVLQSRKHRDSKTEGQEGDEETKETEKELPMLELPSPRNSFSRPLVMKRLSVQADGAGLKETSFQVDEEGGLTEYAPPPSRVLSDDEGGRATSTPMRPAPAKGGVLSKSVVSLREVEESVQYLEAWEGKVAARDGSDSATVAGDTMSIIKAAMYDPSNGLEGARAAANLFARAKKVEREEAHKARKRQSVMRIYQKMPPMESVAAQMIRQHSTGLTAMQILFKNTANNDQSVLDTYQAALDAALDESARDGDSDEDEWSAQHSPSAALKKKRKPKVDMTKLSYREMIWCKAGMGMNISDANANVGDDARLRSSAYKQGVRIMKKEFRSYAFRDHWEALAFYERKSMLLHQLKGDKQTSEPQPFRRDGSVVDDSRRSSSNSVEKRFQPAAAADVSTAENSDADSQIDDMVAQLGGTQINSDEE
eukprot:gene21430-27460_t